MDVILIFIFIFVFLASFLLLSRQKNLPPGPVSFPVLGCISMLKQLATGYPYIVLYEAGKKYGNVMSFKLGRELIVILNGFDAIHEALVKQADTFNDRPGHLPFVAALTKDGGGIIFERYNHRWKTLRRFALQTLRDFGVGKTSIEEKIMVEISAVSQVLKETHGQPMVIAPWLHNMAGNIICGIVFGQRYDYDNPEFEMISNFTKGLIAGDGPISPINFFPTWIVKLFTAKDIEAETERPKLWMKVRHFLIERIKDHEITFDETNIRDFVDLYIKTSRDDKDNTKDIFTEGNILRVIEDLFIAGSESTSTSLDWTILYMIEYPEIQKKCQEEIEAVVGDKAILYAERGKLPYVEATIMEIQRLSSIAALGAIHSTTKDARLLGYNIPKGSMVIPLLYSASLDTKYWKDPEKFNPDRFITIDNKISKNDAWAPFSKGPRTCLGEPLARMQLFLVFSNLLQRFRFEREDDAVKNSFKSKPFHLTRMPLSYKIRAYSR